MKVGKSKIAARTIFQVVNLRNQISFEESRGRNYHEQDTGIDVNRQASIPLILVLLKLFSANPILNSLRCLTSCLLE